MTDDDWQKFYKTNASNLVFLLYLKLFVGGLLFGLSIVACIGFSVLDKNQQNGKNKCRLKVAGILCISCGCGAITSYIIYDISVFSNIKYEKAFSYAVAGWSLYIINNSAVITVFGAQIIKIFTHTPYTMSKYFKIWLIIVIVVFVASAIIAAIARIFGFYTFASYIGGFSLFFETINGIVLLIIFVKKLNKVMNAFFIKFGNVSQTTLIQLNKQVASTPTYTTTTTSSNTNYAGHNNNMKQASKANKARKVKRARNKDINGMIALNGLIQEMSKYTILICIAMISTTMIGIIGPIFGIFEWADIYVCLLICIDVLINDTCLILQYQWSEKYYKKICHCLIIKCQSKQTKNINKNIVKMKLNKTIALKQMPSGKIGFDIENSNH